MVRGTLEIIEFAPRQVIADAGAADRSEKSESLWRRLVLERRSFVSCTAALASLALNAFLVAPVLLSGGAPQHSADRKFAGDSALQWIMLDDSPSAAAATPRSLSSPPLVAVGLPDIRLTASLPPSESAEDKDADSEDHSSLGAMYGRYVGQIQARIDRAWERPRTAIGAPLFQCQVQIDQDGLGGVRDVTLLQCDGDIRWRLSLVHAIEAASPLPAPPNPAVFARHVVLEFRATAYSPGAPAALYEPSTTARAYGEPDATGSQSQKAFQALREAGKTPHSSKVLELRIEGSKAEVEPEHQ